MKGSRRGSKYDLIQAVMEHGITYREADHIVTTVFNSIVAAIRSGHSVDIDGFGSWSFVRQKEGRVWRFGRVINQRPKRLVFTFTGDLTPYATPADVPEHDGFSQEDEFTKYVKTIRSFLLDDLRTEGYRSFWDLRWNSGWFHNIFAASDNRGRYPLDQARRAINETRPASLFPFGPTRTIDLVIWYAHWCAAIDVDRDLWTRAERFVSSQF